MKLLVLSDLHNEFEPIAADAEVIAQADAVVLAGDIHTKDRSVQWAQSFVNDPAKPVLLVAGNHEFYGGHFDSTLGKLRERAHGTNIHVLENDSLVLGDVRFLGCTLWTDFRLYASNITPAICMRDAQSAMQDFRLIRATPSYRKLYPADTVRRHELSRAWLVNTLNEPFDGKTVVVTHHAPSPGSVEAQYEGDSLTPAFASDLERLMGPAVCLWIHGHMHTSFDYIAPADDDANGCGTRVICNPRGYSPRHLNPGFNPALLIEV
ncbi:metallophosphoesterase [uncultured Paraburkholderia sp.]|uniref:metallophosphoesterase n=1 Tax=uncultured Paraburkholderia sp. TaxID=1822466 RepID=UPI002599F07C|nr:metallophosphoesterase [uncultured Paraburkholderia sp.]